MTGFIEQWGTGTNEMVKRCLEWGLPEPEFEYVTGDLVVIFMKTKLTEEYLDKLGLNERQKKAIKYLRHSESITNKEYQAMFGVSRITATRDFKLLEGEEILERIGKGKRNLKYVLK